MRRALLQGGLVPALLLASCAHNEKKDAPIVRHLKVEGAKAVSAKEVKKRILTTQDSIIPFSRTQYFDPHVWRTDLKRVERYYRERGYYQAKVVKEEVKPAGEKGVDLLIEVDEGAPTFLRKVEVAGLEALEPAHREALLKALPLAEGEVFVEAQWEQLKAGLTAGLQELGYAEAKVEGEAQVDLETRQAEVHVSAQPGTRYHFGEVRVLPADEHPRVEAWRIAEQGHEAIEDKAWYSNSARDEAQKRIFRMGVFGAAKVTPGEGDPSTATLPLNVEVQEAPFHSFLGGFGVGVEEARNDVHLTGGYTDRDFLGGLRLLELRATAGWAFLPNAYAVAAGGDGVVRHGPIAKLSANLSQPRLFHPNMRLATLLEVERGLEPAFGFTGGRGRIGVSWEPWPWLSITPSYNLEVYRLDSGQAELGGQTPELLYGCPTVCVLSYVEQTVAIDKRDHKQEPKAGYYLALSLQEGGGPLGGSFTYLRVTPEVRGYVSVLPEQRLTFAARVKVGTLIPLSGDDLDSPIVARFFSGGNGMRGFSTRRLAPMRLIEDDSPSGYEAEAVPVGGNGLFEAAFETRYTVIENLSVAAFVDTGFVRTERIQADARYFARNLLVAVGGGLRYQTPVGPIRLDFAYRPDIGAPLQIYQPPGQNLTYANRQGCFGFGEGNAAAGGAPESPCSLHLSIGEAF